MIGSEALGLFLLRVYSGADPLNDWPAFSAIVELNRWDTGILSASGADDQFAALIVAPIQPLIAGALSFLCSLAFFSPLFPRHTVALQSYETVVILDGGSGQFRTYPLALPCIGALLHSQATSLLGSYSQASALGDPATNDGVLTIGACFCEKVAL